MLTNSPGLSSRATSILKGKSWTLTRSPRCSRAPSLSDASKQSNRYASHLGVRGSGVRETLNKLVSLRCCAFSRTGASVRIRFFPGRRLASAVRPRSASFAAVKLASKAAASSATDTGSPVRTPRTVGWHSSSVLDSAASQIRTSASSPQTRAPPSTAP